MINPNSANWIGLMKASSAVVASATARHSTPGVYSGGSLGTNAVVTKRQPNPLPGPIEKETPPPAKPKVSK